VGGHRRELLLLALATALAGLFVVRQLTAIESEPATSQSPRFALATHEPVFLPPIGARGTSPRVVLRASQSWEDNAVQEPNVWFADEQWHMLYTGGWRHPAIGYATAASPAGPWTKYAQNPVLGHGRGGWSADARQPSLFRDAHGRIFLYFTPTTEQPAPFAGQLLVATGRDATALGLAPDPVLTWGPPRMGIVNVAVVPTRGGFRMMFESRVVPTTEDGPVWMMGVASGRSPMHFSVDEFPVTALQQGAGMFGGPWLTGGPGRYELLYHAAQKGDLGTDIYRATSPDLRFWALDPEPIVTRRAPNEVDQVADPFVVVDRGRRLLFTDGLDNIARVASISVRALVVSERGG
jgi:hypothetical protein